MNKINKILNEETKSARSITIRKVFDLITHGANRRNIPKILTISTKYLNAIFLSKEYKRLIKEWEDGEQINANLFVISEYQNYRELAEKANQQIKDLMSSDSERISLDACKFVLSRCDEFRRDQTARRLTELEQIVLNVTNNTQNINQNVELKQLETVETNQLETVEINQLETTENVHKLMPDLEDEYKQS